MSGMRLKPCEARLLNSSSVITAGPSRSWRGPAVFGGGTSVMSGWRFGHPCGRSDRAVRASVASDARARLPGRGRALPE